jgi:hypothetical protein
VVGVAGEARQQPGVQTSADHDADNRQGLAELRLREPIPERFIDPADNLGDTVLVELLPGGVAGERLDELADLRIRSALARLLSEAEVEDAEENTSSPAGGGQVSAAAPPGTCRCDSLE